MDPANTDTLLQESQAVRESAARLLREFCVVEQWQQYGDVELAGGYRWDLMLNSDIDLYVLNPAADLDLALEILGRFARQGDFLAYGFIDSMRGKPKWADPTSYPEGYYLGMARHFEGREWKVETWLLRTPPPRPDWIDREMTEERRRAILYLKRLRSSGQLRACSFDVYRAVLLGGAQTAAEVMDWLEAARNEHPVTRDP